MEVGSFITEDTASRAPLGTPVQIIKKFVEGGVPWALTEQPRPGATRVLDGKQEALLVALTCATPPDERPVWTMQLLADKLVELKVVDTISDETVRRTLKKPSGQ